MRRGETTKIRMNRTAGSGSPHTPTHAGSCPRLEIQRFLVSVHPVASPVTLRTLSADEPSKRVRHADAPGGWLGTTRTKPATPGNIECRAMVDERTVVACLVPCSVILA